MATIDVPQRKKGAINSKDASGVLREGEDDKDMMNLQGVSPNFTDYVVS